MKPTFRKVYCAPGYWRAKGKRPVSYWDLNPADVREYGSVFGWYSKPLDMDELMRVGLSVFREREQYPERPSLFDFLMHPFRPPQQEIILQSETIAAQQGAVSRHKDDILRLPLGASIRADGPELPTW